MPGLKSVRILGTKAITVKPTEKFHSNESRSKDLPWDAIQELQLRSDALLKTDITDLGEQIKEVPVKLKVESRKFKQNTFSSRIKVLKKNSGRRITVSTMIFKSSNLIDILLSVKYKPLNSNFLL